MRLGFIFLGLAALTALAGCSTGLRPYHGPPITHVYVMKEQRTLVLMSKGQPVATWPIGLGFAPQGHKTQYGDGRTPEGRYHIDRRNPKSAYHLSLGISYPAPADREAARAAGRNPGGDIFIHGGPTEAADRGKRDWTAGCIAVTDRQMERIYVMVPVGTPIDILP